MNALAAGWGVAGGRWTVTRRIDGSDEPQRRTAPIGGEGVAAGELAAATVGQRHNPAVIHTFCAMTGPPARSPRR